MIPILIYYDSLEIRSNQNRACCTLRKLIIVLRCCIFSAQLSEKIDLWNIYLMYEPHDVCCIFSASICGISHLFMVNWIVLRARARMIEELEENLNFIRNLSSMSDFLHSTDSQSYWRWWTRAFDSESRPTISDKFYIVSQKWQLHTLDKWVQCTIIDRILTMEREHDISRIHLLHTTLWKIVPPLPHIDAAAFASQQIIPIPQTADRKAICTCRLYRHYVTTEQEHFATENKFNYLSKISQISFLAVVKSIHSYLPRWPRPPRYTNPPARPPTSANFSSLALHSFSRSPHPDLLSYF